MIKLDISDGDLMTDSEWNIVQQLINEAQGQANINRSESLQLQAIEIKLNILKEAIEKFFN